MRARTRVVVGIVTLLLADSAAAQHTGAPPPHHMLAQTCTTEFEKNVGDGRGFGMAFVADQQGYPGPLHVLELKDRLKLTPAQEARAQALLAAMFAESRPKSARLLDAERKLRHLFASGHVDEAAMRAAVENVEKARADARLVHLAFHLKTRAILTDHQRRLYHEARWSADGAMSQHGDGGAPMKEGAVTR